MGVQLAKLSASCLAGSSHGWERPNIAESFDLHVIRRPVEQVTNPIQCVSQRNPLAGSPGVLFGNKEGLGEECL